MQIACANICISQTQSTNIPYYGVVPALKNIHSGTASPQGGAAPLLHSLHRTLDSSKNTALALSLLWENVIRITIIQLGAG